MSNILEKTEQEFALKHRVAGAAVLLAFGVLFLPWLLGPPKQTADDGIINSNETISTNLLEDKLDQSVDVEQALIDALSQETVIEEEKVYISKITPLNSGGIQSIDDVVKEEQAKESEPENSMKVEKTAIKPKKTEPKNELLVKAEKVEKETVEKLDKVAKDVEKKAVKNDANKSEVKAIEVGWIVSVGVFSSPKNVAAVNKDLVAKGFSPSVSEIDTNKGKATRVWLGPFESRVEAAKVKTRLKEKTGEPGLIKVYP